MKRVTFYTKPDCKLCDAALYVIHRVQQSADFHLECVDIAAVGNESWMVAYGYDIPVVHIDGVEVFRHRVVERHFRKLIHHA